LESWGVRPDVLFGYSAGRMAAAHAAGVFSLPDACRAVGTLSLLFASLPETGGMAAVEASEGELRLDPGLVVAAVNGPRSLVISGDRQAVADLQSEWEARGRRSRVLRVDVAAHSAHLDPVLDDFRSVLRTMELREPRLPLVCDITAKPVGAEAATAEFWVRELREPVRFADAADRMHQDGTRVWLELGPGEVLVRMLEECLPQADKRLFALARDWRSLRAGTDVA